MEIALIAALDKDNGIGKDNNLLCHLPADLRHFKQLTTGHPILMGRKTFDSLPNGPLPNRKNVILTKDTDYLVKNCLVFHSVHEALQNLECEEKLFVIGGGQIYKLFIERADLLYITRIHHRFNADTFFPDIDLKYWYLHSKSDFSADEKNHFDYSFLIFNRKKEEDKVFSGTL